MSVICHPNATSIVLKPPKMVCDKVIHEQIPFPLPNTAHYLVSCGPPRSGKTSALLSMLTQTGPRLYSRAFHNVMVIMPRSSIASLKDNPFEGIKEEKIQHELSATTLAKVEELAEEHQKKDKFSLLFVDDMSACLKDAENLKAWNKLINNRRHLRLSIWCIVQTYKSIPLSNRRTVTHMMLFKPNNRKEGEAIIEELIMMPPAEWEAYISHAFGAGEPHSFLFLDVDGQKVYDRNFSLLECPSGAKTGGAAFEAPDLPAAAPDQNVDPNDKKRKRPKDEWRGTAGSTQHGQPGGVGPGR